jgi:SAM-dependent methyltransferase
MDVPSPIDLRTLRDAQEWEASATSKRPWRAEFFAQFAASIAAAPFPVARILELGSGPGFLARELLSALPAVEYVALDFSAAMHQLAAHRLRPWLSRVRFEERSFLDAQWPDGLGTFECVMTNQAVHELRHKRHAPGLHRQVRGLLAPGGMYLVCDHFAGQEGMKNVDLYMSVDEQRAALLEAGFQTVEEVLRKGGLVLHQAT